VVTSKAYLHFGLKAPKKELESDDIFQIE